MVPSSPESLSTWHSEKGTSVPDRCLQSALDSWSVWGMDPPL